MRSNVSILIILIFIFSCKRNREEVEKGKVEEMFIVHHEDKGFAVNDSSKVNEQEEGDQSRKKEETLSFHKSYSQRLYETRTVRDIMRQMSENKNISSYQLMAFGKNIGGLVTMYQATDTVKYFEDALALVEDVMKQVKRGKDIKRNPKLFKDNYLGWENRNADYEKHKNGGKDKREIPLFESRFLRYVAQMLYIIENDKNLSINHAIINKEKVIKEFVEVNGWRKWFERGEAKEKGCYPYLFRNRTHMTSHWALVALYLEKIATDPTQRKQYREFLDIYDQQLKANFKVTKNNAYKWNMTWDSSWPYNTECNQKSKNTIIQDVAHGNHVVAYIVEAYNLGSKNWTKTDIQRLCNTLKYIIYDNKNKRFYSDLSQNLDSEFADGIRMSDGFQYLSRYDKEVFNAFETVLNNKNNFYRFRQNEPQYVAERQYAIKIWKEK